MSEFDVKMWRSAMEKLVASPEHYDQSDWSTPLSETGAPLGDHEYAEACGTSCCQAGWLMSEVLDLDATSLQRSICEEMDEQRELVFRDDSLTYEKIVAHYYGGSPKMWYILFLGGVSTLGMLTAITEGLRLPDDKVEDYLVLLTDKMEEYGGHSSAEYMSDHAFSAYEEVTGG